MGFSKFMASGMGRLLRIVAGLVLIAVGLMMMEGTPGYVVAVIGVVPLFAGVVDICIFAPLFGMPLGGKAIREKASDVA